MLDDSSSEGVGDLPSRLMFFLDLIASELDKAYEFFRMALGEYKRHGEKFSQ